MGRIKRGAFTLVELLVVVAIISLLLSILLPALDKARSVARDVICLSNMRSLGIASQMYVSEHNTLPPQAGDNDVKPRGPLDSKSDLVWSRELVDNAGQGLIPAFTCPSQTERPKDNGNRMFVVNTRLLLPERPGLPKGKKAARVTARDVPNASDTAYLTDYSRVADIDWSAFKTIDEQQVAGNWAPSGKPQLRIALRVHQGKFNILYLDTHAEPAPMAGTEDAVWDWTTDRDNWQPEWRSPPGALFP